MIKVKTGEGEEAREIEYDLKYTIERFSLAERSCGISFVAEVQKSTGLLAYDVLNTFLAYGLKLPGANSFLDVNEGREVAEKYIMQEGFMDATMVLIKKMQKDLPFLFKSPTKQLND